MELTIRELCGWLELPQEVIEKVQETDQIMQAADGAQAGYPAVAEELREMTDPAGACDAHARLREKLGADEGGWKMLTCMLQSMRRSWELYQEKGIGKEIFVDTMKCFSRFVKEHKASYGCYGFDRSFWTWRQLSLRLFRLGVLEFELMDEEELPEGTFAERNTGGLPERASAAHRSALSVHIPSDASLKMEYCLDSIQQSKEFFRRYFPERQISRYFCDSWLLSPALKELLPQTSNILQFQKLFEVQKWDAESDAFLEWVYLRKDIPTEQLPEDTSLRRRMKAHLLAGGRVGEALGELRSTFI